MNRRNLGLILGKYAYITFFIFGFFYYFTIGSKILLINNLLTSFLSYFCCYQLKKDKISFTTYSHLLISGTFTSLFIINLILGGITSPMLYWFLAPLLGSGFMLGSRWMAFWGGLLVFNYLVLFIFNFLNLILPFQIVLNAHMHLIFHLSSLIGVVSLVMIFAWSYIDITQQYNQEIQESNDRNSFLLKILNHDLANPIIVLDLYTKKLSQDNFEEIKTKLRKSLKTVVDILNSARTIDKFHISEIELEDIKLKEVVSETLPELEELFSEKKINFLLDIPDDTRVKISKNIFSNQILKNLLTNACKFSIPNSNVSIIYKDNNLIVRDTGIGIPEDLIGTLFDYKSNNSQTGTMGEKGTGFGLPIVKDCCDKMNIQISVTSNEKGTDFTLRFT